MRTDRGICSKITTKVDQQTMTKIYSLSRNCSNTSSWQLRLLSYVVKCVSGVARVLRVVWGATCNTIVNISAGNNNKLWPPCTLLPCHNKSSLFSFQGPKGHYLMYVWPCIIYEHDGRYQLDATIVIYYHKYLYMFQISICPSSFCLPVCYPKS